MIEQEARNTLATPSIILIPFLIEFRPAVVIESSTRGLPYEAAVMCAPTPIRVAFSGLKLGQVVSFLQFGAEHLSPARSWRVRITSCLNSSLLFEDVTLTYRADRQVF